MKLGKWVQEKFGEDIKDVKRIYGELRKWMRGELRESDDACAPIPTEEKDNWLTKERLDEIKSEVFEKTQQVILTIDLYFIYMALKEVDMKEAMADFILSGPGLLMELSSIPLGYGKEAMIQNTIRKGIIQKYLKVYLAEQNPPIAEVIPFRKTGEN